MSLESTEIQFATTSDGTAIAHRTRGDGPSLLHARGWINDLVHVEEDPGVRAFFGRLERHFTVTRYDGRGNGKSDRALPDDLNLSHLVDDLATVADVASSTPFTLWATSWAGPAAIQYAADNPDKVEALILDGTFAHGPDLASPERRESFLTLLGTARFQPDAVYASLSYLTDPDPAIPHRARIARARETIEPDALLKLYTLLYELDVTDLLERVVCPTLIMHRASSRAVSVRSARDLAADIPGSLLIELKGSDHNLWEGDTEPVWDSVASFLGCPELKRSPDEDARTRLVSVVFVDQVASTDQMRDLGDKRGVEVQSSMIEMLGHAAAAFGAEHYSDTGDGVVFLLDHAGDAVALAQVLQRRIATHNRFTDPGEHFRLRIGVHTGTVRTSESGRTSGLSIPYASRLCDLAPTDGIVVSDDTRGLAESSIGSQDFDALPPVHLKGIGDARPHRVTWRRATEPDRGETARSD